MWITILSLASALPSIPWSYYSTFVLEEKHGFNKSTRKLWIMDQLKTYALLAALGLPFLAGFLWIIEWAGKSFVPFLMVFLWVTLLFPLGCVTLLSTSFCNLVSREVGI